MKKTHVAEYGDIKFTLRNSTGWDRLDIECLFDKVLNDAGPLKSVRERTFRHQFCRTCILTVQVEGFDFKPISLTSTKDEVQDAYSQWMALDGEMLDAWLVGIDKAEEPPGKRSLLPPELLTDEEKADPK